MVGVPGIEPEPRTYLVKGCIKPRALHELYAVRIQRALCQSGRPRTGIFSLPKGVDVHLSPHSDKVLSFILGPVVGLEPTKWPAKLLGLYQFDNYSPHRTFGGDGGIRTHGAIFHTRYLSKIVQQTALPRLQFFSKVANFFLRFLLLLVLFEIEQYATTAREGFTFLTLHLDTSCVSSCNFHFKTFQKWSPTSESNRDTPDFESSRFTKLRSWGNWSRHRDSTVDHPA